MRGIVFVVAYITHVIEPYIDYEVAYFPNFTDSPMLVYSGYGFNKDIDMGCNFIFVI